LWGASNGGDAATTWEFTKMGGDWEPITLDGLKELGKEQYDPIDDVDDHDASLFFKTVELSSGFDTELGWRSIL